MSHVSIYAGDGKLTAAARGPSSGPHDGETCYVQRVEVLILSHDWEATRDSASHRVHQTARHAVRMQVDTCTTTVSRARCSTKSASSGAAEASVVSHASTLASRGLRRT